MILLIPREPKLFQEQDIRSLNNCLCACVHVCVLLKLQWMALGDGSNGDSTSIDSYVKMFSFTAEQTCTAWYKERVCYLQLILSFMETVQVVNFKLNSLV